LQEGDERGGDNITWDVSRLT